MASDENGKSKVPCLIYLAHSLSTWGDSMYVHERIHKILQYNVIDISAKFKIIQ
jgi:hypothetical protein